MQRETDEEMSKVSSLRKQLNDLTVENFKKAAAIAQLQRELNSERTKTSALQSQVNHLTAKVAQGQQELDNEKWTASNQANQIQNLASTVHFQLKNDLLSSDVGPEMVDEAVSLVIKSQSSIPTAITNANVPEFTFTRERTGLDWTAYTFWLASHNSDAAEILEEAHNIFNSQTTPLERATQSPWVDNALLRLSNRFLDAVTTDNTKLAVLMVQAIAYLGGLISPPSLQTLTQAINQYNERMEDGFILRSIQSLIVSVDSWLSTLDAGRGTHVLDHTNSALAENMRLVAEKAGLMMLIQTTEAGVVVHVFDKEDIEAIYATRRAVATFKMKPSTFIPEQFMSFLLSASVAMEEGGVWDLLWPLVRAISS
ncbi:MAG: hypothetical protein Q9191_003407 [Dirinaria sp. TL-2023a]